MAHRLPADFDYDKKIAELEQKVETYQNRHEKALAELEWYKMEKQHAEYSKFQSFMASNNLDFSKLQELVKTGLGVAGEENADQYNTLGQDENNTPGEENEEPQDLPSNENLEPQDQTPPEQESNSPSMEEEQHDENNDTQPEENHDSDADEIPPSDAPGEENPDADPKDEQKPSQGRTISRGNRGSRRRNNGKKDNEN